MEHSRNGEKEISDEKLSHLNLEDGFLRPIFVFLSPVTKKESQIQVLFVADVHLLSNPQHPSSIKRDTIRYFIEVTHSRKIQI